MEVILVVRFLVRTKRRHDLHALPIAPLCVEVLADRALLCTQCSRRCRCSSQSQLKRNLCQVWQKKVIPVVP